MFPNSSKKLHNPSTQRTEPAIFSCSRSFWFNRDWGPKVPNPRKHNSQTQRQQRNWIPRFNKARFFPLKQRNPDEGSRNSTIRARGRGRRRWKNSLAPAPVNTGKREVTAARGSIYIYTRRAGPGHVKGTREGFCSGKRMEGWIWTWGGEARFLFPVMEKAQRGVTDNGGEEEARRL